MTTFSALFIKTYRITKIISATSFKAVTVPMNQMLVAMGAFMGVDVVLLLVWTLDSDSARGWVREVTATDSATGLPLESEGYCAPGQDGGDDRHE